MPDGALCLYSDEEPFHRSLRTLKSIVQVLKVATSGEPSRGKVPKEDAIEKGWIMKEIQRHLHQIARLDGGPN
jgi:hypothetical protein